MGKSDKVMIISCVTIMIFNHKTHMLCAGMWLRVEIVTIYTYTKFQTTLQRRKKMNPRAMTILQFE